MMALNAVHFAACSNQLLLPLHERLVQQESNVSFRLTVDGKDVVNNGSGTLYATTQRVIFRAHKPTTELTSVFVPLAFCRKMGLVQPLLFGANYIHCEVEPFPGGTLSTTAQLRITFNDGGAIEFYQHVRPLQLQLERLALAAAPPAYDQIAGAAPVTVGAPGGQGETEQLPPPPAY